MSAFHGVSIAVCVRFSRVTHGTAACIYEFNHLCICLVPEGL